MLLLGGAVGRGDSIKSVEGKVFRGEAELEAGTISITATNGEVTSLSLSNIDAVVFSDGDEVIPGERNLTPPWSSQDVGSVAAGGGARQESNSFTIRCSGTGMEKANDGFHFVYLPMTDDVEIIAKVTELKSRSGRAQAGLMIRQTLGPESAHAVVLLNEKEAPAFQYRVSRSRPNPPLRGPKIPLPCWVKLERHDKFFVGSVSADGKDWKIVGSQTVSLGSKRNLDDQWFMGLAVSSRTNTTLCTARFEEVQVHAKGIRAELFSDDFKTPVKTVVLPGFSAINRAGADDHPAAIRWTGQWTPRRSDKFTFSVRGAESAKLWINEKAVLSSNSASPISLKQHVPVNFRLETRHIPSRRSALSVLCAGSKSASAPLADSELSPYIAPGSETREPQLAEIDFRRPQLAATGVVLKDGSVIAAKVHDVDGTTVLFSSTEHGEQRVSARDVARIQFRSLTPQLARRLQSLPPGLLLVNGDLIEGDLKSFKDGKITISSVIFGFRTYEAGVQAAAVVLRPASSERGNYLIRTISGSAVFASRIELKPDAVTVQEPILGAVNLPVRTLLDLRRVR